MVRRRLIVALVVVGGLLGLAPLESARPSSALPATVERRVLAAAAQAGPAGTLDLLVSLDDVAGAGLKARLAALGTWSWSFAHVPVAAVRLPAGRLDALRHVDGVQGIYLNRRLSYLLKDSAKAMNVGHAWNDLHITGKGVTVAILDSGVDGTHPDLAPAMKQNVKLVEYGAPTPVVPVEGIPNSDTSSGHGTHVAGDVAGRGIMSAGDYRGLAPDASLVGIGAGDLVNIFTVIEGFDYVLANRAKYGIRAVNNSWGSEFEPFDPNAPINKATKAVTDAGVVVLFAMGNAYDELTMNPWAAAPWVVPVAAGTKNGVVTDFSSGGIDSDTLGTAFNKASVTGDPRAPGGLGLYHPAVTSTGENVISTRANNTVLPLTAAPEDSSLPPDRIPYYTTFSGTSMATPETAGVVADILQADPVLTPAQVRSVLETTARPIAGVPFWKQGYGYTDASGAVELALRLAQLPANSVAGELDGMHQARDRQVLGDIARPTHTWAWLDNASGGAINATHTMSVPAGTVRVKIVANGPATPEANAASWDVAVDDAKGTPVGSTSNTIPNILSGTAVLDLNLRELDADPAQAKKRFDALAWGDWTVTITSNDSPGRPASGPILDELPKPDLASVASIFDASSIPCRPVTTFVPAGALDYRLQSTASGAPDTRSGYTFVGVMPDGQLANRTPARKLSAAFDEFTTGGLERPQPLYTTDVFSSPVTFGGAPVVQTWVQGPSETLSGGALELHLVDLAPDGTPHEFAGTTNTITMHTDPGAPARTDAVLLQASPYTVPAGHRLGLRIGVLHSQNTAVDRIYFDSDEFPTGVHLLTGHTATVNTCGLSGPAGQVVRSIPARVQAAGAGRGRLPATGGTAPFGAALVLLAGSGALSTRRRRRRDELARPVTRYHPPA